MNKNFSTAKIDSFSSEQLGRVYKQVFAGHPWHEDLICSGALRREGDPQKCLIQYTSLSCEISNDNGTNCKNNYKSREGIVLLPQNGLEKCVGCGNRLETIEFYPAFFNHNMLINEVVAKEGFIGYLLLSQFKPVGFGWGYRVPLERTITVNFPAINQMLRKVGIDRVECFYAAELGLVEELQNQGLGSALSAMRLNEARSVGFKRLITRTINPVIKKILKGMFSQKEGKYLFNDPEKKTSEWYMWNFDEFNPATARDLIRRI